jgi:uncharacterized protein YndB with AHSA1/START domain
MSLADHDRTLLVNHATLVFERDVSGRVDEVFEAFARAKLRAEWGAPSDTAVIIYDADDFREGGEDRYRCGSRHNPNIHCTTRYLEIVNNGRIVSSETVDMDGRRLGASLTTLELCAQGQNTRVKCTVQVVSFIGPAMIEGHTDGHNASLDNLVRHFNDRSGRSDA